MNRNFTQPHAWALMLMLFIFSGRTFAQTFQWARGAASQGFDYGNGMAVDDSGNVYVAGQIEYSCNFGGGIILNSSGKHDIFIAKYNTAGVLQWARHAGGKGGDVGWGIGLDNDRNIYLTGEMEDSAIFDPGDTMVFIGGPNNIFVAKYTSNGVFQWVKRAGGTSDAKGRPLAFDRSANCFYSSGYFTGTGNFGTINLSATAGNDMFIAKWDTAGNCIWAKKGGGTKEDRGRGLALDNMGNVYSTGTFTQSATFGGTGVTASGLNDTYLAKYDTNGTFKWVRTAGGTDTTRAMAATCDNQGNVYITGYFIGTANFGSIQLVSLGSYEFFMAKYDSSGNVVWAKRGGGANEDFGQGICYDANANLLYVAGQFDFQGTFDTITVNSVANRDAFFACYDTTGHIQWIRTGGGTDRDAGFAIANDTMGSIYGTGFFGMSGAFGNYSLIGDTMANIFVTKISPPLAAQPSIASTNLNASVVNCSDITLNWTNGNGDYRMLIAKAGSAVSVLPVDGVSYTANSTFGSGSYLGSGNYVVYSGSGNTTTVTGLTAGTHYYFALIEFNGRGLTANYNTTSYPVANLQANSFIVNASALPPSICPGGTTTLSASGGLSYTWSPSTGLSATTGSTVTATLNASVTYTVTATDGNGCIATTTLPVTVNPLPTVTLGNIPDACISSSSVTLSGGSPAGGTYSGAFVTNGIFNPAAAGTGSHAITYSYTDGNGCSNSATANIMVHALPVVTVNTQAPVCLNASPVALSGGTPAGGTYSGTGVSSGNFDPALTGTGIQVITYSYTDAFGCANSDTATILVNAIPVVALSSFNPVCVNSSVFALSGGTPAGGTYSGTGVANGNFNPSLAGAGTQTITYTYADANGCSANASNTILVNALPVVTLGTFNAVCQNSGAITLTGGSPAGGTYSGSGVSNGIFTPASVGLNTIIYNYTDANGCTNSATSSILVNALPTVSTTPFNAVCQNSGSFVLTGGIPAGGTWTGNNVVAGSFNPVIAGSNMVIYNYTNANGCSNFATASIMVNAAPVVTVNPFSGVCQGSSSFALTGGNPAGGVWSGNNVNAGNFNPVTAGPNTVTYTYTDANGCTGSANATITVNAAPVVSLGPDTTICMYSNILLDAGAGYASYLWSNGLTTQTILVDTTGIGIGTETISVTVNSSANCSGTDNINITFDICAGISQVNTQAQLGFIFPNPFGNSFTLFTDAKEEGIQVTLSDVLGNIILKKDISSPSEVFSPNVVQGIYFLRIDKGKTNSIIKIVKTN